MNRLAAFLALAVLTGCTASAAPRNKGVPSVAIADTVGNESETEILFGVTRDTTAGSSSVTYRTVDGSALAGKDYVAKSGTVTFANGENRKTIAIQLIRDPAFEPTETFSIKLQKATNARIYDGTGIARIIDDTVPTPPPPATQICADGSVIPATDTCPQPNPTPNPPATQTCPDGSVILATETCPPYNPGPTTKICWDGSEIPIADTCPPSPPPPPTTKTCWDGSVIPIADTCPPQPGHTPDPYESPNGLVGMTAIASNFTTSTVLGTAPIPSSAAPDVVGAFRFICLPGKLDYLDPIVSPGPRGTPSAHLHQFYGNDHVYSDSTYAQLRGEGGSTCNRVGDPFAVDGIAGNRSAYWIPAMLDGQGNAVRPDYVTIYYKRRPKSDPKCNPATSAQAEGICVDMPHGLRFIFGRNMLDLTKPSTGGFKFKCDGPSKLSGLEYNTMAEAIAVCPTTPTNGVYNKLGVVGLAPSCWDGKNLDSADHRSHMAYKSYGSWGYPKCPSTHPYVIPAFTIGSWFTVDANLNEWELSSDMDLPAGSTFHADFFEAWDPAIKKIWHENCIDKMLNCSAGDMGNGQRLLGTTTNGLANPRLVPVPAPPAGHVH